MGGLRHDSIPAEKRKKFFVGILAIALIGVSFWYLSFSFAGLFGRSVDSVSNTEWVSWNVGTLYFGETTGTYNDSKKTTFFRFEEQSGSVKVIVEEKLYMALTRVNDNKIITSDGMSVFYLKGEWSK